ncbi:Exocyst complex component 3 [Frankliniella fusca]|uniref:Exocyst complex component 3 n=1 Tax=Frankliniella fusca TaxID=407009 RepID=A0AAE1H0S3_9NEOP|nr:Exocyst complex component 3 [Frankliniella fusca]
MDKLEAEARATATKHVINMLQRPGQLEKVEQYKRRVSRKKASVEAMLKTAMQSQLDGVRVGLDQLQVSLSEIKDIKESLKTMDQLFCEVPALCENLQDVKEENSRHSQYVTAMENLKHIFTVPECVEKTKQWISEGDLLHARQSLTDLENSRDDLLWELHKSPNQSAADCVLLAAYFEDVEELSSLLEKQVRVVLGRTLNTVRKEPTIIVTALRIVEWQEMQDEFAAQREKQSGFKPPGRPKHWRKMAMEVLERSVSQRIEGTHVDERDTKMWLVRYLELTRQLILEDLRVVKTLCEPCFPPSWNIVEKYVEMYHTCLSRHLEELVQSGLEGNEMVSMLAWTTNTYSGPELMQHPELNFDTSHLGPLLSESAVNSLQEKYLKVMENNYQEWMRKTLEAEQADWRAGVAPEGGETDGFFHTSAPVIIFQMIDQNLVVTKIISQELTHRALLLSMDQVAQYGHRYRDAIITFKTRHFEDRSLVPFFTHYMITIVNNCLRFVELAQSLKAQYWRPGVHDRDSATKLDLLLTTFQKLRNEAAQFLLDEAFLDLDLHFKEIATPKWLTSSIPVDTICVTLEDYFQDYVHLCEKNFELVITEAQNSVARRYLTALLQRKLSLKELDQRRKLAKKVTDEADQLKALFRRVAPKVQADDSPLDALKILVEVIRSEDAEMLSLDLITVIEKYPDITEDHLSRFLSLRGDITRQDIKEKLADVMKNDSQSRKKRLTSPPSIFSQIICP